MHCDILDIIPRYIDRILIDRIRLTKHSYLTLVLLLMIIHSLRTAPRLAHTIWLHLLLKIVTEDVWRGDDTLFASIVVRADELVFDFVVATVAGGGELIVVAGAGAECFGFGAERLSCEHVLAIARV